jgi:hypothetical protein
MLRFKSFIIEKLEGDLGNHEAGTLHEIIVAHSLNGGKHVSDEAKNIHDEYSKRIGGTSSPLYQHHLARAQKAAETIRGHAKSKGEHITSASWTPRAAEKEGGHADPSDIYAHTESGKKIGVSLKVGDTHGTKPISNPGASSETKANLQHAREEVSKEHPHTKGMSTSELKAEVRSNPDVAKTVDRLRKDAIHKSVASLHKQYAQMNDKDLHHHVMKLLHAGPEYGENHIRVTTTGVKGNYKSSAISPSSHYDTHIQPGKIEPVVSGTSVLFKHKDTGKTLARHRLKFESSGLTSIKGSGESSL